MALIKAMERNAQKVSNYYYFQYIQMLIENIFGVFNLFTLNGHFAAGPIRDCA